MTEKFCARYYLGEDKVTFANLQTMKQRVEEDPIQFIQRFEDISLVETCISNVLYD